MRMWIGLCLAGLSPSPNLLVLLQGDRFTWVWPGTLPGFSDSAGEVRQYTKSVQGFFPVF